MLKVSRMALAHKHMLLNIEYDMFILKGEDLALEISARVKVEIFVNL